MKGGRKSTTIINDASFKRALQGRIFIIPGYECNSPIAPCVFFTALYQDTALLRPRYWGTPTAV